MINELSNLTQLDVRDSKFESNIFTLGDTTKN